MTNLSEERKKKLFGFIDYAINESSDPEFANKVGFKDLTTKITKNKPLSEHNKEAAHLVLQEAYHYNLYDSKTELLNIAEELGIREETDSSLPGIEAIIDFYDTYGE